MNLYRVPDGKRTFYSIDREPTLNLSVQLAHIEGLDDYSVPHPMVHIRKNASPVADVTGSGPGGNYLGSDMRAAYYGGSLLTGAGQCVGLFEFGGYRLSDVNLTFNNAGQSYGVPVNNVLIGGTTAVAGSDDEEQVLDIVQAISMAPNLTQVRVYIGSSGQDASMFNTMATEDACKQLSVSWSWITSDPTSDDYIFQELAAQGQSVFVASGDYGAYDASISPYFYPAEDAYVTAVGGTHLTTNYGGGPWVTENAWNNAGYGSGGGASPDGVAIPSWQQGLADYANGGSTWARNVPDVSMEGDTDNFYCAMGSCSGGAGGTSFSAARWAGFMALINQQATETGTAPNGGLGFLNPTIYSIGEGSNFTTDFHDITSGNNDTANQPVWYSAVPGYDLVTGWGSPNGQGMVDALAGAIVPGFWLSSSPATLSLTPGTSANTTIAVTDAGGFTGNVTLAASGLPNGITASFNPSSTGTTSELTLTADNSTATGTATITITGISGSSTASTQVFLTINPTQTPTSAAGNLGSVNVGATSSASAITVTFATAGTLNSIAVLTQGSPNLDFANSGGGSCAIGTAYAAGATCMVNVTFSPKFAGMRYGAIVLSDASGNRLAQTFLQGTGVAPQISFNPGTETTVGSGLVDSEDVATLGNGNLYVTDYGNSSTAGGLYLETLSNGTYTQTEATCTFKTPVGVAVDGSGTIYVSDPGTPAVYKVAISGSNCTQTAIGSGFVMPWGLAVDGNGDLYVADLGNSSTPGAVYKETLQADGTYVQSTVGSNWVTPTGVAVDGNGNIYVADYSYPGVFKETPSGGGYAQTPIGQNWTAPVGISIDGSGSVYVSDIGNSIIYGGTIPAGVYKESPVNGAYVRSSIGGNWTLPYGVVVDASGNLYVADNARGVYKEDLANPPQIGFANAVAGTTSADSAKTVAVSNSGNAALTFSSLAYPTDFPEATGAATDCTSNSSLQPGGTCTLSIDFTPITALGSNVSLLLNESLAISTNNLNSAGTQQPIPVSGTEVLPGGTVSLNTSTDPGVLGAPITFTATVTGTAGGPTPTGTVTFLNGATPLGSPIALTNGVASYSTSSLTVGAYQITASYSGDSNYQAATSNAITESIVAAPAASGFSDTSIGNQNVGSTSSAIPLTITFTAAATLGNIAVLTEGAPNLDFTNAGGGSCATGTAYAANATCTVNITFSPKYPGTRYGAVVLTDTNGNVVGTGYLEGTGVGPQTSFLPGTLTSPVTGLGYPEGVAVDGSNNLYIADASNAAVYKETYSNGTYTQSSIGSGFSEPFGVAVDSAGNIYVADSGNHSVYKETLVNGSYVQTEIGYGLVSPMGVAVDGEGNVYIADYGNGVSSGAVYLETLSNGGYTQSTVTGTFNTPQSVAVDGSGDIFVADPGNGNWAAAVYELTPSSGSYTQVSLGSGWVTPSGVSIDGRGDLYVADDAYDTGAGFVSEVTLQDGGGYVQTKILNSGSAPYPGGLAIDGSGNLYLAENLESEVDKDDLVDPPGLSFATTMYGSTSNDSPKAITIQNAGNAALSFSALSYPTDFPESLASMTDCTAQGSLPAGTSCTLTIDFSPDTLTGSNQPAALSEKVSITTNTLNASSDVQNIAVSGTEDAPVAAISLSASSYVSTVGTSVTFTASVTGSSGLAAPTGSVTFYSNGAPLGTFSLTSGGTATYSTSSLSSGGYSITAVYSGDSLYPSVTSSVAEETIIPNSTFGAQHVGISNTKAITVTFSSHTSLGSIAVVTQGMPNLDFTDAGGGTCTAGASYASGSTCTVNVAFQPLYSGARYGAVVLGDSHGNLIQDVPVQGTGVGPQLSFPPTSKKAVVTVGFNDLGGDDIDASGNIYAESKDASGTISVSKWTLSGGTYSSTVIPTSTLSKFGGVGVDSSGNVYIADAYTKSRANYCRLLKESFVAGAYTESVITTLQEPYCVFGSWPIAVDASGNVYISDNENFQILKETLSNGTYTQTTLPTGTLYGPGGITVDSNGNVFFSDYRDDVIDQIYQGRILELTPNGGSYVETTIASNTTGYGGPTVDGHGDVYFDTNSSGETLDLEAVPSGSGYTIVSAGTYNSPDGIYFDSAHNSYTGTNDSSGESIIKVDHSDLPSLSFAATGAGATSSDSPKTITLTNVGNAPLSVSLPPTGTNPSVSSNFSLNSITTCPQVGTSGPAGTLNVGASCVYGVNFVPTTSGTINGSLVLTDNALGAGSGTQTFPLSGTGTAAGSGNYVMAVLTMGPNGVPVGRIIPNATSLDTSGYAKVWVDQSHKTFILGAIYLQLNQQNQVTCNIYSLASATSGPMPLHGTLSYTTENYELEGGMCPGIFYPFRVARYTWGSSTSVLEDPFVLQFRDQYGDAPNGYGFNAELAKPLVQNGCLKGGVVGPIRHSVRTTLTLNNPPESATSYKWTIS